MTETLSASLPTATERLVDDVLRLADECDLSLATAESCTGGLLASILTDVEGRSHVFERGFVVYTNEAKAQTLDVDPDLLATAGAVSEPVARAMAEGAMRRSGAGGHGLRRARRTGRRNRSGAFRRGAPGRGHRPCRPALW